MRNWNWYAVQPVAGNWIVMGDFLYFCERAHSHGAPSMAPHIAPAAGCAYVSAAVVARSPAQLLACCLRACCCCCCCTCCRVQM